MHPTQASKKSAAILPRVAIVDGHAACRMGLTMQLATTGCANVVWTSATAEEAFGKLASEKPDLLIVEIHLTGQGGLEFIKNIQPLYPDLKILVHSSLAEDFYATRCLQAGALGFLHKAEPMSLLIPALETVLDGKVFLSARAFDKALRSLTHHHQPSGKDPSGKQLTDRELEIILLMAHGDSCQNTADKLRISPRTVQVHRTNIRNKLGLDSALRLHTYAVRFYGDGSHSPTGTVPGDPTAVAAPEKPTPGTTRRPEGSHSGKSPARRKPQVTLKA